MSAKKSTVNKKRATKSPFDSIESVITDIRRGKMVIVVDDAGRENEGDLVMAAEKITPEAMSFIVKHTSGIVCVPVTADRLEELHLPMMVLSQSQVHLQVILPKMKVFVSQPSRRQF